MDALKALGRLGELDRVQVMWSPRPLMMSIPVGRPYVGVTLLDRSGQRLTLRNSDRYFREAWRRLNEDWDLEATLEQAKALKLIGREVARRMQADVSTDLEGWKAVVIDPYEELPRSH
jgi:hypothetical protein